MKYRRTLAAILTALVVFSHSPSTLAAPSSTATPIVLNVGAAFFSGQWSSTTVSGASYNVTPADPVHASLADYHYVFAQSGWYVINVQVPRIPKLATHVRYMARIGDRHRDFYVDQSGGNGGYIGTITIHAFANEAFTLTMVNAKEREAVAGNIELTPLTDKAIELSANEGTELAVTCPAGESIRWLHGVFGDLGTNAMCSFNEFDAQVWGNSGTIHIGNNLCGDPSWGISKQAEVSVICK
jgi:hypothetical protein